MENWRPTTASQSKYLAFNWSSCSFETAMAWWFTACELQ
jgi:hypothetical protein